MLFRSHLVEISGNTTVAVGDTTTLTAKAFPEAITGVEFTWTSSSEANATVAAGVVTGVATGATNVTAKVNGSTLSATVEVVVVPEGSQLANFKFVELNLENGKSLHNTELKLSDNNDVTVTFAKGSGSSNPAYYTSGTAVRAYAKNTFKIAVASGKKISQINITFGASDGSNAITASAGTYDAGVWTGDAAEVTFTVGGTSGNRRIASIIIIYK